MPYETDPLPQARVINKLPARSSMSENAGGPKAVPQPYNDKVEQKRSPGAEGLSTSPKTKV